MYTKNTSIQLIYNCWATKEREDITFNDEFWMYPENIDFRIDFNYSFSSRMFLMKYTIPLTDFDWC